MRFKYFTSLAGQFFAFISIVIVLAMSINAYIQFKNETNIIEKTFHGHAQSLSDLLASISVAPLLTYDDVTLNDFAEFTSIQKNVVFAAVVNLNDIPLTHYINRHNVYISKIKNSKDAVDIKPIIDALKVSENILFVESPVIFDNKTIAKSWIGLDRRPYIEQGVRTLYKIIFVTIMVSLFVGGAIYILFRVKIFRPVEMLTVSMQNIAKFKFEKTVEIKGKGEISILASTFEKMRLQLKELIESRNKVMDELSELNNSLEERVVERTHELQILNSKIAHQAVHDPLTGLPNRVLIVEQLQKEISHSIRDETTLAVFMIDLNNFKDVNDTLGHPVGDKLLKNVATRIKTSLRESDTVGRLGGDEFAVVLPSVSLEEAVAVAEKILAKIAPSFILDEHVMKVGASIGIAMSPLHGNDHTSLIRVADVAMYDAKKNNTHISVYEPELDKFTHKRLELLNDLHVALVEDQLELFYQPKVSIKDKKVLSVEALLRWEHPKNGWIPPDQFIEISENSDLINDLSYWVLNQAFKQWRKWKDEGTDLQVSVNLSAKNLIDPKLPSYISELNEKYKMEQGGVKAEITESAIMSNTDVVMKMMASEDMKKMHFSIDDFGTGYSSLSYLKKLTVNEVKIDKTFVSDMATDEDDESIVKSVIDLTHNLGYSVVAEGVETLEVLERLTELGCDEVQGYYFSKAVPESDLSVAIINIDKLLAGSSNETLKKSTV